jgi:hypothetical protein
LQSSKVGFSLETKQNHPPENASQNRKCFTIHIETSENLEKIYKHKEKNFFVVWGIKLTLARQEVYHLAKSPILLLLVTHSQLTLPRLTLAPFSTCQVSRTTHVHHHS